MPPLEGLVTLPLELLLELPELLLLLLPLLLLLVEELGVYVLFVDLEPEELLSLEFSILPGVKIFLITLPAVELVFLVLELLKTGRLVIPVLFSLMSPVFVLLMLLLV